ncbi:unnamed protein product [Hyaloperonospora brassicae]|uniref:tryptophan--tRNA ligase n=1 Tax=Hyaloperonospora brassicae TaxID=162125 RepID=A0AAV0TI59_HYABA|nr:unnamed protein product [Hyaloperonospora brassicae]
MTSPHSCGRHLSVLSRRPPVVRVVGPSRCFTSTNSVRPPPAAVRVFSGIQPSGVPHLGNYCGAISKWVQLQSATCDASIIPTNATSMASSPPAVLCSANHRSASPSAATSTCTHVKSPVAAGVAPLPTRLFAVADLHAMTVPFDAAHLTARVYTAVAALLAAGIDPTRSIVFRQSHVAAHAELMWLLSCVTPLGWLHRMTQFKHKTRAPQQKEQREEKKQRDGQWGASIETESSLGLLSYPVLMAADILLYRAMLVPVGDDQLQHLELARMIAAAFNNRFGREREEGVESAGKKRDRAPVLLKPWPMEDKKDARMDMGRMGEAQRQSRARIMSLRDPTVKMSKSDASAMSRIELTDSADTIRKKLRKATTDAVRGIYYDRRERPGVSNLLDIASAVTEQSVAQLETQYADYGTGAFKDCVADAVIAKICPIGERIKQYEANLDYLDQVLADGAAQASEMAAVTMKEVKEVMGLVKS